MHSNSKCCNSSSLLVGAANHHDSRSDLCWREEILAYASFVAHKLEVVGYE